MTIHEASRKLRQYFASHKRLPSYSEMAALFGYTSKKASYFLAQKLIESRIVAKDTAGKLIPGTLFFSLPLLGSIKAGLPDEAYENLWESVSFDQFLISNLGASYALKVSGDSMIEAGIHPGDIVIIEKDKTPKEGDIIVAEIDGEFTLKYLKKIAGKICLVPANRKYRPLYPRADLSVFGVVVSVVRKYH